MAEANKQPVIPGTPPDREAQARLEKHMKPVEDQLFGQRRPLQPRRPR